MSYHTGFLNCIYSGSYHVCFFFQLKSDAIEINSDINRIDPMTTDRGVECFFQVIPIGIMGLVLTVNGSRPSSALVSIKIA